MRFVLLFLAAAGFFIPDIGLAQSRTIRVEWEYPYNVDIAGFRLYHESTPVCETTDSSATSMNCTIDAPDGTAHFTMTTFLADGTESETSETFTYIFSGSLKAVIAADPVSGESPLTVAFDATGSTGNIILYEWMFGDGETGTGSAISHTYPTAGTYTATLTTTDTLGAIDGASVTVTVTDSSVPNSPPSAVIASSSSVGPAPLQVDFDGSGSADEDGIIVAHEWDMGDGGAASGAVIQYTYTFAGTFNAKLTVKDDGGLTDSISTPVLVSEPVGDDNVPPVAIISASARQGYSPLTVSFSGDKSNDPDGEVMNYVWNFGDGTTANSANVRHTYTQPAVYTVTLRVTDNMGDTSQLTRAAITVLRPDQEQIPITKRIMHFLSGIYKLLLGMDTQPPVQEPAQQE